MNTETFERTQHEAVVYLGVKVLSKHGVGQALINSIEAWSLNHNIRRIEATVVTENSRAIELLKVQVSLSKVNLKINFYKWSLFQ